MSVQNVDDRRPSGSHERGTTDKPRRTDRATVGGLNGHMLMAAVVSAISGLLYGYDTGIISARCCRSPTSSTSAAP
ncbi:hypothetical protein [Streptomyces bauhiniae]|uniref:hypothetical protein n=1 Tax=Streptomyces bauhiniae TaxID=2340725 RepID=UPI001945753B|nr:hypothetical protein [Streptomyces bauhiniae]